jgi:hypothetical protein
VIREPPPVRRAAPKLGSSVVGTFPIINRHPYGDLTSVAQRGIARKNFRPENQARMIERQLRGRLSSVTEFLQIYPPPAGGGEVLILAGHRLSRGSRS